MEVSLILGIIRELVLEGFCSCSGSTSLRCRLSIFLTVSVASRRTGLTAGNRA